MTEWRQTARLHQARWREAHGHPIGTQPIAPRPDGKPVRLVGSRIPLEYGRATGATFLTKGALRAARARMSTIERNQSIDHQRTWADLLSSEALAFNLFGDLADDVDAADRAVHRWWPEAPGRVSEVRFAHSPGWLDPEYLNSLRSFDVAFALDRGDGTRGVIGIDTKYHERAKSEIPKPQNLRRYLAVAEGSGAFRAESLGVLPGRSELAVMWLEHLLLHSMLQHPSGGWTWGRYIVIHPSGNPDIAGLCARYSDLLADGTTFSSKTIEALLDAAAMPSATAATLRERYLPD